MYSEMNSPTNDVRWNSKSKKKYELSLKKIRNHPQSDGNCATKRDRIQAQTNVDKTMESEDLENFKLRLSDSFAIEDTYDDGKAVNQRVEDVSETEVILISDSSDEGTPEKSDWTTSKSCVSSRGGIRKSTSAPDCVYKVKSSDSEDSDELYGGISSRTAALPAKQSRGMCSIAYTSDEDITNDESGLGVDKTKNSFGKSRRINYESPLSSVPKKTYEDCEDKLSAISERFRGLLKDEDSSACEFLVDSNVRENLFYKNNNHIGKSRTTHTTTTNNVDGYEKKFTSSTEKFGINVIDDSDLEIESEIIRDGIINIIDEAIDKDDRSHVTPASTRNFGDSAKKLVPSCERLKRNFNSESELAIEIGSDRRENIFDNVDDKENKWRVTPTAHRNNENSDKKLISSSEKFRGILTDNESNRVKHADEKCSTSLARRFDEWKRTPISAKLSNRTPGSSSGKPEESRKTPISAKLSNRTPGSTSGKPEESRRTPISAKISSRTTVLTKNDTRRILKVIKSKQAVYESPKLSNNTNIANDNDDDDDDDDGEHENSSMESIVKENKNIVTNRAIVIAETDSDSDDKVIQGSRVDTWKPHKTHVTRFLEPGTNDDHRGADGLSEKKKLEVAKWLLTNTVDTTNDSSISNISCSKAGSPTSGNSSLERLEQNYETPNNRDRFKNIGSNDRPIGTTNSTKSQKSIRQTTIDNYVMKTKDGKHNILTPINVKLKKRDLVDPIITEATESLGIMDCADILDNLYGNEWRAKADDLLPSSEPRKPNVRRKDKGVQTERKVKPRTKNIARKTSSSSSQDEDFDAFVRNIKPNLNSTKKPPKTTGRRRFGFINDSPSSAESGAETTYLTALTNPRISNNLKITRPNTPASLAIQKVRAICDPDTDEEVNRKDHDYRKQLSFSDDDDSSTSEYDPNDVIPPKTTPKITLDAKTPKNSYKPSKLTATKARNEKSKSFLTSLSATVPINEAHADAKKYRQNYKTTKDELGKHLYALFNEKVFDNKLPKDMSLEWNVRMRGTAGYCYNKRSVKALGGVTRSSRIVLATKILDTPDRLRDTLIHEMCHAAAWLINEVSDGHGPFWKGWASKAMRAFPELPPISRCHDYKIKTKFTYRCTGCGYSVGRHSKSLDVEKKRCGHCYGKFELLINKVTKSGTVQVQTPTSKQPTGFALFVKENYHSVKKDRKGVAHKEVMQILGQQFSAIKITKKVDNSDDSNSDGVTRS